jgi:hypothetical protein
VFHKTQPNGNVRWNQSSGRSSFAPPVTPLTRRLLVYFASGAYNLVQKPEVDYRRFRNIAYGKQFAE